MNETLSVVVLNAEGDQFNASLIADGKQGGIRASTLLYQLAKDRSIKRDGVDSSLIVYLVADRKKSFSFPEKRVEAFFEGFASTENPSFVVEPIDSSPVLRVTQLLDSYLPLDSTSSLLVGSLHTNLLYPYLVGLPPQQKNKITLLSTVTIAPCYRQLTNEGWFKTSREFESLFGELLMPDVAAKMLWDSVDTTGTRGKEVDRGEPSSSSGGDIWSNGSSWRAEDNPISSTSSGLGLIWDTESDEELPSWGLEAQLQCSPPLSPHLSSSPVESSPVATKSPTPTPAPPSVSSRPPESSSILARAQLVHTLRPHPAPSPSGSPTSPVATTSASTNPLPVRPTPLKGNTTTTLTSTALTTTKEETITQTPLGPVSSLPTFQIPMLTFSAFTQPCKRHYCLSTGCPQTAQSCRFSHEFPFTPEERKLFPYWVKGTVCMDASRGKCKKGEACHQGHRCPFTNNNCPFGKSCKFRQKGMPHSSRV